MNRYQATFSNGPYLEFEAASLLSAKQYGEYMAELKSSKLVGIYALSEWENATNDFALAVKKYRDIPPPTDCVFKDAYFEMMEAIEEFELACFG